MRQRSAPFPAMRPTARWARGMTLVEVLVTIVLLGMLASIGTGALMGVASAGERARAVASVRRADAMARSLARAERPVELRIADDGGTLETWLSAGDDDETPSAAEWRTELPARSRVSFHRANAGAELSTIRIDSTGRSDDVTYLVTMSTGEVALDVAGRTGQLVERREAPR